jgi:hypothetical protein
MLKAGGGLVGTGDPWVGTWLARKIPRWMFTLFKITCSVQHGDDDREVHFLLDDEDPDYQVNQNAGN